MKQVDNICNENQQAMVSGTKPLMERIDYHKDGSVRAKGMITDKGILTGYWEWFRKDGTKLRSGYFENGEQVGEWVTYDNLGRKYKVTNFKPKAK